MRFLALILFLSFFSSAVFGYLPSLRQSTKFTGQSMKEWKESDRKTVDDKKNLKWQPGANQLTIQRPEGARTYYAYVPSGYTGSTPLALHISMHGLGDSCENFGPAVGFSTLADQTGSFIYVYPCGYPGLIGNAWNAGTCCLSTYSIDDVQFMKDIVNEMKSTFNINSNKIFASGFSNGAMMAERLACEAGDVFRAVASVSGVVELEPGNEGGLKGCDTSFASINKKVSVLGVHGDADFTVPWTGDELLGFPPIPENFDRWASRNACSNTTVQTLNQGTFTNQVYQGCSGDIHIEVVKNEGGTHEWPQTSDFDTTKYIFEYFNKFQ